MNVEPWMALCRHVDAVTVDIKAMTEQFYRAGGAHYECARDGGSPVL
jgi:pyruvate-formate lyase-activating enzyme